MKNVGHPLGTHKKGAAVISESISVLNICALPSSGQLGALLPVTHLSWWSGVVLDSPEGQVAPCSVSARLCPGLQAAPGTWRVQQHN